MGAPLDWSLCSAAWRLHPLCGHGMSLSCLCWSSRGSRRAPVPLRIQQCTWRGAQQIGSHSYPQGAVSDSKALASPLSPSLSGTPVPLTGPPPVLLWASVLVSVAVACVRSACGMQKQPLSSLLLPPVPCRWPWVAFLISSVGLSTQHVFVRCVSLSLSRAAVCSLRSCPCRWSCLTPLPAPAPAPAPRPVCCSFPPRFGVS